MSAMTSLITLAIVITALGVLSFILFMIVFIVQNRAFKKEMLEAEKKREINRKNFEQRVEEMDFVFEERKRQRSEDAESFEREWAVVKPSFTTRPPSKENEPPKRKRPERPSCIVVRDWDGKVISGLPNKEDHDG